MVDFKGLVLEMVDLRTTDCSISLGQFKIITRNVHGKLAYDLGINDLKMNDLKKNDSITND
jgi:hypothetical protein